MAAPSSKTSSSLIPSRPTNPRSSEVNNTMRRSFSGNPFAKPSVIANQRPGFNPNTPANSPSGYPRRNSIGRENILVSLRDSEDKENSKDQNLKQDRVRSPVSSKGTKNFMSPTISATSKISASPRKKILTDRNESIRNSVSFSDGKSPLKEDLDLKPQKGLNQKKEVSFDPVITYVEDNEAWKSNEGSDSVESSSTNEEWDLSSESVTVANDCVNLDPSFNISPRASFSLPSPGLAPLDADPSMPPYDPKTNYLSPRPQFLHYKPNPRIELYLRKGRDGKQLEDSFASESSSDTEITEEQTLSDDSQKESEDSSSSDVVEQEVEGKEEEGEEEEEGTLVVSEPRMVAKSNFFTRTKFAALLLILASACLWSSVSNSPIMDPSVINNLSFSNLYVPPEISQYLRENLEGLTQRFGQWVYESLSYICNVLISLKERDKPISLQFANLTTLLEDSLVDNWLMVDKSTFGAKVEYENNELGPRTEGEGDIESLELEEDQPIEADENVEEVIEGGDGSDKEHEDQETIAAKGYFVDASVNHIVLKSEELSVVPQAGVTEPVDHIVPESEELNVAPQAGVTEPVDHIVPESEELNVAPQAGVTEPVDHIVPESEELNVAPQAGVTEPVDHIVPESEELNVALQAEVTELVDHIVPESEQVDVTPKAEVKQPANSTMEVTQEIIGSAGHSDRLQSHTDIVDQVTPVKQAAKIQLEVSENDGTSAETESTIAENVHKSSDSDVDQTAPIQQAAEVQLEVCGTDRSLAETEPTVADNKHESLNSDAAINPQSTESAGLMMGISLLVLSLISVAAYIYMKNRTSTEPNAAITVNQVQLTKKLDHSPLSVTTGHTLQERTPPSANWQTEVETIGESCPSEMSSFQYSLSSFSKQAQSRTSEACSKERKPNRNTRRESLASSEYSTESPSYGSFTTYEKISKEMLLK
ncbi:uncharacterized protein LOC105634518 isoform X2 [Jatropha curcas]|uniref:uncharacterized protein LOC105634518 isoform X2 n=1 Tax=Jatropha curcas TaxID=180498 RepID=UPI0018961151|nr:uncharacterized protein LOC105634518 isoform X2 [Jatropha curcas]